MYQIIQELHVNGNIVKLNIIMFFLMRTLEIQITTRISESITDDGIVNSRFSENNLDITINKIIRIITNSPFFTSSEEKYIL